MSQILLLTSALQPSAEVLPSLSLLAHQVRILPAEGSALLEAPDSDLLLVDGRQDLAHSRDLCRLIRTTGTDVPATSPSRALTRYPKRLTSDPPDTTSATLRVRPGGPGWATVSTRIGFGREAIPGGALAWTNWIAGIVASAGSSRSVGWNMSRSTPWSCSPRMSIWPGCRKRCAGSPVPSWCTALCPTT